MGKERWGHSLFALNGKIITLGGYKRNDSEIFDVEKNEWQPGPNLPFNELSFARAVVIDNCAIITGGDNGKGLNKKVLKYSLESVEVVGELSEGREGHVAVLM